MHETTLKGEIFITQSAKSSEEEVKELFVQVDKLADEIRPILELPPKGSNLLQEKELEKLLIEQEEIVEKAIEILDDPNHDQNKPDPPRQQTP